MHIAPGATSVGLAVPSRFGEPYLAMGIGAVSSRLTASRQRELVARLRSEISAFQEQLPALSGAERSE